MARAALAIVLLASLLTAGDADRLRQDIGSLDFLNRLALSRQQTLGLLPIAERGAILRREFERERDALYVRFHDALVRFKEEDLRNEGLSDEVIRDAGGTNHALKMLGNRVAAALGPLEQQAAGLLNARQRRLAFPSLDDRHPLDLLRTRKGSDYGELRDTLARHLANSRVKAGLVPRHADREERLRIRALLHKVGRLDEGEYKARREELLRVLVPGRERAQVAAEIRRIYAARYGRAGPLAEHLFRERMLPVLAERAGVDAPKLPAVVTGRTVTADLADVKHEIAELKADINLLNLMNGLHLNYLQLKTIQKSATACGKARAATPREEETTKKTLAALREVYDALRKGEPPPASAVSRLQSPAAKRGGGYLRARHRELEEARASGVEKLLDVLSPEQGEVIRTYAACLVPPKNLRDPVRAGQATDTEPLERMLDHLRKLPLDNDPYAVADRFLSHIESHDGRFPADERPCTVNLVLGVAYDAQALDDVGYAAQRSELAARLAPARRLPTLKEKLGDLEGADVVIHRKIAIFLLDPRIAPLAKDRIKRQKNGTTRARGEIPKADFCTECGKR
ncbi:MAG: hypothetical protein ACYSUM_07030 [Planctomycetota bacterium]|jgi:hypothetical protein